MSEAIGFDDAVTLANIDAAVLLMRQHDEGYPGHADWVDKSVAEIEMGKSMYCWGDSVCDR